MNVEKATQAMLAGGVITGKPTENQIRQLWRNLTDDERNECISKITGEKDATGIDDGHVPGNTKRARGKGKPADVSV